MVMRRARTYRNWLVRVYAIVVGHFMRLYDFKQAQKVKLFVANSEEVKQKNLEILPARK